MKNIILGLFLSTLLFTNCVDKSVPETTQINNELPKRIIIKENSHFNSTYYQIIEIDGVEYITTYHGGICPLVKK